MALRPISRQTDFAFPEEAWDVRGWTVRTRPDDEKVGSVEDMLLDRSGTLRYLDVDMGFLKKHVLVPLDHAWADRDDKVVWIETLTKERLGEAPEHALDPEALDEGYERRLDTFYGGTSATAHRDLVAPTTDDEADLGLQRLDTIEDEYRVAGDDPRKWEVVTGDGRAVGRVAELLVDPGTMKARYLDVALDERELELEPVDRHILLPADHLRLDRKKRNVVAAGLLAHDLDGYPQYPGLPLRHGQAREIDDYFRRAGAAAPDDRLPRQPPGAEDDDWRGNTLRSFYGTSPRTRRETLREE
ncbi:MAG TPA: PRC-barrel domain-containing protein [Longimicrobiales bacterium]|nr:PRC-barrel domain-containing protein [Longimicrobiales bacterium]